MFFILQMNTVDVASQLREAEEDGQIRELPVEVEVLVERELVLRRPVEDSAPEELQGEPRRPEEDAEVVLRGPRIPDSVRHKTFRRLSRKDPIFLTITRIGLVFLKRPT